MGTRAVCSLCFSPPKSTKIPAVWPGEKPVRGRGLAQGLRETKDVYSLSLILASIFMRMSFSQSKEA